MLVDDNLRPWLMEINASPSLACDWPLDHRIKGALIRDIVTVLKPTRVNRRELLTLFVKCREELDQVKKKSSLLDSLVRRRTNLFGKKYANTLQRIFSNFSRDFHQSPKGQKKFRAGNCVEGTRFKRIAPNTPLYKRAMRLKAVKVNQNMYP